MSSNTPDFESFSPREFLRARRPERFSDSIREEVPELDRCSLEYHLETLTSRSQETDFEIFARHVAEREICPNLRPQTGPTGGGDSKVDTETYPIADNLALAWYTGKGRESADERWAFAFSTKQRWRQKIQSDVEKIAQTRRGYKKAFFVTSRYVRDRTRAEVEDSLTKKHGLDVVILDRQWILDKVFSGNHLALAIEDLRIATLKVGTVRKGPLDTGRERRLEELESRILTSIQEERLNFQLVNDAIETAILSRELECSRTQTDGRFDRATRMAAKCGTSHQRLECAYQRAWTAFWWLEDYDEFRDLYDVVETHAVGSQNTHDIELLCNIWMVLWGHSKRVNVKGPGAQIDEKTQTLLAELKRLCENEDRPSNSLFAQTLYLLVEVATNLPDNAEAPLAKLRNAIEQSEGLVGYPLESFVYTLLGLGEVLTTNPEYDRLFEYLVRLSGDREGEVKAARLLCKRGSQHLRHDRPYEAIRYIGRAMTMLYKDECREDLISALFLCGCAYERVGLLWAARGTTLAAASLATDYLWTYSLPKPEQAATYNRLKWIELQIGRLPQALDWHGRDMAISAVLRSGGEGPDWLGYDEFDFDAFLGILLMRAELAQLKDLEQLPDVLERLGLPYAATALLYALGHEEECASRLPESNETSLHDFFQRWRDQPAAQELPLSPALWNRGDVSLESSVLGCRVAIDCANESPIVELAESILAALESLLATGIVDKIISREPKLTIDIQWERGDNHPFSFDFEERNGRPHVHIKCKSFSANAVAPKYQALLREAIRDLILHILARIMVFSGDPEEAIKKLLGDDHALERSLNFTGSFIVLGNVLGEEPRARLDSWTSPKAKAYELRRSCSWGESENETKSASMETSDEIEQVANGRSNVTREAPDFDRIKHTQVNTMSLIREPLWNQADWCGTAFVWPTDRLRPPILAMLFRDGQFGRQIVADWIAELGEEDRDEQLRVTIVRGIDRKNQHAYRVCIGLNPDVLTASGCTGYVAFLCRLNTMEPNSSLNLDGFLDMFGRMRAYFMSFATLSGGSSLVPEIGDIALLKRDIQVRYAWEIGVDDVDSVCIRAEDEPFVPSDRVHDAPVSEVLKQARQRRA